MLARQLAAGTVLAGVPERAAVGVAIYARVSCFGRQGGLGRQVFRLAGYLTANGLAPAKIISGVGSGRNGHRTRLVGLLWDASVGTVVAGQVEVGDDLVRDRWEVLTSLCARLHGRRSAKRRAEPALAAARSAEAA